MSLAPSILRGRIQTTTYLYEDTEHPDRPTGAVRSPAWTEDDRSLLLGLAEYELTLCPGGCGQPRTTAWHADAEGHYEGHTFVCHACTAKAGKQVVFSVLSLAPPADVVTKFMPFDLLKTTTEPTPEGAE